MVTSGKGNQAALPRLKKMAAYAKGETLDIGFAKRPNPYLHGYVIGLDLQRIPRPENYSATVVGDVTRNCFAPVSFDTILAGEVIEHLEQPIQFLRDCRRLLKPGGLLVFSTPNPYYPPIILLNWFMIRRYFFAVNHKFEVGPRYMVRILENTGYRQVKMVSGGALLPVGKGGILTVPLPKAICYHMIYIAEAF